MSDQEQQDNKGGESAEKHTEQHSGEVETKARAMGWVPKDEFRGDPEKWREADEFVQRGENELPILRERLRHQSKKLDELQGTIKQFAEYHSNVEKKAFQRAMAELKAQQVQAVASGDANAFVKIDTQIEELRKEASEKAPISVPQQQESADFQEWHSHNRWYQTDREMSVYADKMGEYVQTVKPGLPEASFLEEVAKEVKKRFPEKFENPRRASASAVEGGGNAPRKGGKGYADLPPEAKAACDKFVKQGLIKSREDYVKSYEWE